MRMFFIVLALLLGGCASTLRTEISTFHQIQAESSAGSIGASPRFAIMPLDAEQRDSLEYQSYAALVSGQLQALHWTPVPPDQAAIWVTLRYGVGSVQSLVIGDAFGSAYGGFNSWGGYWGPGWGGPRGAAMGMGFPLGQWPRDVRVVYLRELILRMERSGVGGAGAPAQERIYEATVRSEGNTPSLPMVMPAMIRALFRDFPGPSGGERSVEVLLKESG